MRIIKSLNNNMVLARDSAGGYCICAGKGIGFGRHRGDKVDPAMIERRFVLENESEKKHYTELFSYLPDAYWQIAIKTADYGKNVQGLTFPDKAVLPLADHITGAIERYRQGVILSNPLLYDIERVYGREFLCGKYAVSLIKEETGIEMNDAEAAFIAWHFINAGLEGKNTEAAADSVKLISSIIDIVEQSFQTKLDPSDWNYKRFLTHLKFFAARLFEGNPHTGSDDDALLTELQKKYRPVAVCVERISDFILINYHYEISKEEKLYLLLHVEQVTRKLR